MENESQNRRWYMFESAKISFSKCCFHEFKVKIFILDKSSDHLSLLQQSAYAWFQQSSSGLTVTWSFKMTFSFVLIFCY